MAAAVTWIAASLGFYSSPTDGVLLGSPELFFELRSDPGTAAQNPDGSWDYAFPSGVVTLWDVVTMGNYPLTAADIGTTPGLVGVIQVLPFTVGLTPLHDDSVWGLWGARPVASLSDIFIDVMFGSGVLRGDLASLLGVSPNTIGGSGVWFVDDFLPNPNFADCSVVAPGDASLHCAVPNNASIEIELQAVPEPAIAALLIAGLTGATLRRRRRHPRT